MAYVSPIKQIMITDLIRAFAFLTILPVPQTAEGRPGRAFAYFPLVGLVIGLAVFATASIQFLPGDITAFLTLIVWVILTGGLHLDGFADSCDGLLATTSPERRLEVMKDPRAGSWAVIGIALLLLGKYVALRHVTPVSLILPPVLGRWGMVLAAYAFPYARTSGLGTYFRDGLGRTQVIAATTIILMVGVIYGWPLFLLVVVPPILIAILGRWASRRLGGGLTGDVYGALCELVELVCLLVLIL